MQVEKNNSKENQENKSRSLVKKLSFLWVILLTITAHFIVYYSDLKGPSRGAWFFCVWVFGIAISRHYYLCSFNQNYRNRKHDIVKMEEDGKFENENLDQIYLNDKYLKTFCYVTDIWTVSNVPGTFAYSFTAIKYKFLDQNQKEFFGIKKLNNYKFYFVPKYPKLGDKMEIIYNRDNPNDSMIFYKKVKEYKWPYWNMYEVKTFRK